MNEFVPPGYLTLDAALERFGKRKHAGDWETEKASSKEELQGLLFVGTLTAKYLIGEPLGLRDVASTSYVVRQAVRDVYLDYQREAARHPGQTPVVEVRTFKSIKMKNGSAYAPNFQIVDWVATRPEFGGAPDEPVEEPARPNDADLSDGLPPAMRPSV